MPNTPIIVRAITAVEGLALVVDGYPTSTHRLSSKIGAEPLEDGREVVDHVVAEPRSIVLTGKVSDYAGDERPKEAWQAIVKLWQREEPVRVVTEWETLDECIIARCEAEPSGRGMTFELELRHVLRVSTTGGPSVPASAMTGPAANRSGEVSRGRVGLSSPIPIPAGEGFGSLADF